MNRKTNLVLAAIMLGSAAFATQANAAARPCEDVLKEYRATKATTKASADMIKKADALEAKAVERCNADDDKRADQFLMEASKLLGK